MHRLFRPFLIAASWALAALTFFGASAQVSAEPLAQSDSPVVVTAGDIVECSNDIHYYTAYLLESIDGLVLPLGDNVYEIGSKEEFNGCYDGSWGRFKDRTRPTLGNHEYGTQGAEGYFTYFGDAATPLEPGCKRDCKGYYSYDVGAWHVVSLNSEIDTRAGSEQEQWLRADLAANGTACTLVYWHRPRFSSAGHGDAAHDLFQAAYDYGADILLSGHDHTYERFGPQDPNGEYDPEHGLRQFVVGTGGSDLDAWKFIQPNSEAREAETWGVLKLTLHPESYDWEFIPMPGQTYTDAGSAPCVSPANPPADLVARGTGATAEAEEAILTPDDAGVASTAVALASPAAGVASAPAQSPAVASGKTYAVKAGDTLFGISLQVGVSWTAIAELNGLSETSLLQIGQVLQLPGAASAPAATTVTPVTSAPVTSTAGVTTTAQSTVPRATPGQTTAGQATAGTTAWTAPAAQAPTAATGSYTVKQGDTIITIALANDVDWLELLEINGLEPNSLLQIGQKILLP